MDDFHTYKERYTRLIDDFLASSQNDVQLPALVDKIINHASNLSLVFYALVDKCKLAPSSDIDLDTPHHSRQQQRQAMSMLAYHVIHEWIFKQLHSNCIDPLVHIVYDSFSFSLSSSSNDQVIGYHRELAGMLVALPDYLDSCMLRVDRGQQEMRSNNSYYVSDKEYKMALCRALRISWDKQTNTNTNLIQILMEKLIVLGSFKRILSVAEDGGKDKNVTFLKALAQCIPEACVENVIKAAVFHQSESADYLVDQLVRSSPSALRAVVYKLPFYHDTPSFAVYHQASIAIPSRVFRIVGSKPMFDALLFYAFQWADVDKLKKSDIQIRRQLTCTILAWMKALRLDQIIQGTSEELVKRVLSGVQTHLAASDTRVRFHGMMIAQTFAVWYHNSSELSFEFDRVQGEDRLLLSLVPGYQAPKEDTSMELPNTGENPASKTTLSRSSSSSSSSLSSLSSFDMSDEERVEPSPETSSKVDDSADAPKSLVLVPNQSMLAKEIGAVYSLPRLLTLIRRFVNGDEKIISQHQILLAALHNVQQCVKAPKKHAGIYDFAEDMARSVFRLEPARYPPEIEKVVESYREVTTGKLAILHPGRVGFMLIKDFVYGKTAPLATRSQALSLIADTARECSLQVSQINEDIASRRQAIKIQNRFAPVAGYLFHALRSGIENTETAMIDLHDRDTALFGQIIATMAVIISTTGKASSEIAYMSDSLLKLCIQERGHSDAAVRRAVMIAFRSLLETMPIEMIRKGEPQVEQELLSWLNMSSEYDPDDYVRRFAESSLRLYAVNMNIEY